MINDALIGLARATENNEDLITKDTDRLVIEGLFTTVTNVNFVIPNTSKKSNNPTLLL